MVNIWKIGSWPGLWYNNTIENKEKYINEYALPENFVAIGSGYLPNIKKLSEDKLTRILESKGKLRRKTQILNFANVIDEKDVILLYNHYKVYVGIVKEPYYHVKKGSEKDFIKNTDGENIAPHRIDVEWQFNKVPFDADFSKWQDVVHQVFEEDLDKISNMQLRKFLRQKLHD